MIRWTAMSSPIGVLGIAVDEAGVCEVRFDARVPAGSLTAVGDAVAVDDAVAACRQLAEYLRGVRTEFDLPLSVPSGTAFERAVWARIAAIGYAETCTYGDIARALNDPGAARAVGTACNRNPLPIIVPCHRVVGSGGKLVGFGGGLTRKRFLLELEARVRVEHAFTTGS